MRTREIIALVEGTSDAAFAVDGAGRITAWNHAAEALFGRPAAEAVGGMCGEILQGVDECGPVCSGNCCVQQSIRKRHPVRNFDLQVQTPGGKRWCNVSVLIADEASSTIPYAIHIVRQIEVRKRLELLMRDFIVANTDIAAEQATTLISSTRAPARDTELSDRELEVLKLLARGVKTSAIAEQLHISRTTINNHIQHILKKLDSHTRLEAIRRAERAGLI
ncbi:MAG TPA: LuxR C-terminal-related transcriptional regulator [Blastocatellia bacterium]|nr:LuxR C-terminal-related transcriptional regulator [Blastocatellia bacterium]